MNNVIIITGANKGLGKALVDLSLKDNNSIVISLSRSLHDDHQNISLNKLIFIKTDLSEPFSVSIFKNIDNHIKPETKIYFFSNAGIILPINKIGAFSTNEIDNSLKVNINYPINLINFLLKKYNHNKTILINISSGAGDNPIPHWSLYCSAKAYMKMFFRVLEQENPNDNLKLFSIDPGVMDTDMQESIRDSEAPKQDYFKSLKEDNKLIQPNVAALKIFEKISYNK